MTNEYRDIFWELKTQKESRSVDLQVEHICWAIAFNDACISWQTVPDVG